MPQWGLNVSLRLILQVNPMTKAELKFSDYKKVPQAVVDGQLVPDSTDIISFVYQRVGEPGAQSGLATKQEERRWRKWVDQELVHCLPANIYRTPSEALQVRNLLQSGVLFTRFLPWLTQPPVI